MKVNKKSTILTSNEVIHRFLDNDLERFLKRWYRQSYYQLSFSVTLKKLFEENSELAMNIVRKSNYTYPGHINNVLNVFKVLIKHYNFYWDFEDYKIAEHIEYVLEWKMSKYRNERNLKRTRELGIPLKQHTRKQAIKEMKARGFIPLSDFEDYDRELAQVRSKKGLDLKEDLVYPANFMFGHDDYKKFRYGWAVPHIHNVMGLIGVQGYSRISTPSQR